VVQKRKALISVSRKEGVVELAKELKELGFEIISTGGTYNLLKKAALKLCRFPILPVSLRFSMAG